MYTKVLLALVVSAALVMVGCGENGVPVDPTVPVMGKVNLDGKPMPAGEISFSLEGKPPQLCEVANGAYEGVAMPGNNRVEIKVYETRTDDMTGDDMKVNILPNKYNLESTLKAPVSEAGPNEFDFEVQSK